MFQLTQEEFENLTSHFAISSWGGRRTLPYVFTEQGIAMLSSVLRSERAILVNISIMRAFVKLREILSSHKDLEAKLKEHDSRLDTHDRQIHGIFEAIRQLMLPPEKPKRSIGFHVEEPKVLYGSTERKMK
ncbi:MAG: ORF6N domain-containing protein [Ignavibacteriales bacterium]|nr:ORF6N domain-containing protein [Ignavibacteriales bacterium]